jgi:hypothetical protein
MKPEEDYGELYDGLRPIVLIVPMRPAVPARPTFEIVAMKVVTLTCLVFSLAVSRAPQTDAPLISELSEKGRRVR